MTSRNGEGLKLNAISKVRINRIFEYESFLEYPFYKQRRRGAKYRGVMLHRSICENNSSVRLHFIIIKNVYVLFTGIMNSLHLERIE